MSIYVLKVSLFFAKCIYRRIAIDGNQTLDDLHHTIYEAFDREEEHLYSFYFPSKPNQSKHIIRQSPQFTHPFNYEQVYGDSDYGDDKGDASKKRIGALNLLQNKNFTIYSTSEINGGMKSPLKKQSKMMVKNTREYCLKKAIRLFNIQRMRMGMSESML